MSKDLIQSPLKDLLLAKQKEDIIIKVMGDLLQLHKQFIEKVDNLNNLIDKKVGPRGAQGPKGEPGESVDTEAVISYLLDQLPSLEEIIAKIEPKIKYGRNPLTVSPSQPINPKIGDLWYKI